MAAGSGHRLGGAAPKQYQTVGDRTVLRHAIDNLLADPRVAGVQVVIDPAHRALYEAAVAGLDCRRRRSAAPAGRNGGPVWRLWPMPARRRCLSMTPRGRFSPATCLTGCSPP